MFARARESFELCSHFKSLPPVAARDLSTNVTWRARSRKPEKAPRRPHPRIGPVLGEGGDKYFRSATPPRICLQDVLTAPQLRRPGRVHRRAPWMATATSRWTNGARTSCVNRRERGDRGHPAELARPAADTISAPFHFRQALHRRQRGLHTRTSQTSVNYYIHRYRAYMSTRFL